MTVEHHTGDVLEVVAGLPDDSVDLVACSPPFLGLRNYNDLPGQWGSEATPAEFLANLLELAGELRRVLTPHGSIAFELGDTYAGSGGAGGDYLAGGFREDQPHVDGPAKYAAENGRHQRRARRRDEAAGILPADRRPGPGQRDSIDGWPMAKSLCMTPTLFAASLAYGWNMLDPDTVIPRWRVRNQIVWARPNPMPGSLADKYRPATSYITVATVSGSRWFDLDAVRTEYSPNSHARTTGARQERTAKTAPDGGFATLHDQNNDGRGAPPLDYWTDEYDGDTAWLITAKGSALAHYAMWPAQLAERLILSMCPPEVCVECGEPRRRIARTTNAVGQATASRAWRNAASGQDRSEALDINDAPHHAIRETLGWTDCGHGNYRPGVVLDPFAGTGTTLAVADMHDRDAIGIDLDPANQDLYERRHAECKQTLFGVAPPTPGQLAWV